MPQKFKSLSNYIEESTEKQFHKLVDRLNLQIGDQLDTSETGLNVKAIKAFVDQYLDGTLPVPSSGVSGSKDSGKPNGNDVDPNSNKWEDSDANRAIMARKGVKYKPIPGKVTVIQQTSQIIETLATEKQESLKEGKKIKREQSYMEHEASTYGKAFGAIGKAQTASVGLLRNVSQRTQDVFDKILPLPSFIKTLFTKGGPLTDIIMSALLIAGLVIFKEPLTAIANYIIQSLLTADVWKKLDDYFARNFPIIHSTLRTIGGALLSLPDVDLTNKEQFNQNYAGHEDIYDTINSANESAFMSGNTPWVDDNGMLWYLQKQQLDAYLGKQGTLNATDVDNSGLSKGLTAMNGVPFLKDIFNFQPATYNTEDKTYTSARFGGWLGNLWNNMADGKYGKLSQGMAWGNPASLLVTGALKGTQSLLTAKAPGWSEAVDPEEEGNRLRHRIAEAYSDKYNKDGNFTQAERDQIDRWTDEFLGALKHNSKVSDAQIEQRISQNTTVVVAQKNRQRTSVTK